MKQHSDVLDTNKALDVMIGDLGIMDLDDEGSECEVAEEYVQLSGSSIEKGGKYIIN